QKNAIQSAQESLLARLPAGSFSNPSLSTHIPFLGLEVDKDALAQLIEDPDVSSLRADQILQPTLDVSIPLIRADVANGLGCSGAGQAVVVLDTGADAGHSFFAGTNIAAEACFSTTNSSYGSTTVCPNGGSTQTGPGAGTNCNTSIYGCNHGTHVSGIAVGDDGNLFGVARDADLILIQAFSRFGSYCSTLGPPLPNPCALNFTGDLRDGLNHVADLLDPLSPNFINQPIAAVNLSLGGGAFAGTCDTYDPGTTAAIDNLRSLGVATVVSSGNGFVKNGLAFPACITNAVSVGATNDFDNVPSFSQSASNLDLLAPGVAINSSVPGGSFQSFSGTSMAAPHVAGAWACHMSTEPSSDVATVLDVLAGTGVPVIDPANAIETHRIDVRGACCMPISTANMVGWWTGDSGAPDDISGNGNHASWIGTGPPGTPISPNYSQPGMVDDAFSFTASNQVILRVPDDPTLNFGPNSFSVDAWVNLQGAAPLVTPRTIVKKQDALGDEGYWLFLTGNHICYGLRSNTGSDTSVCTISTIPTTGWHFLVWSVDRQTDDVRIYIDGSLALTINIASFVGSVDPADDLEIGTDFEGLIDEVEIFDYA
ncbi:MAG: S8 family serine peptidase, partial [Acidimicrobiales bacterium]|nr:S8 family serine peptidase [Acidimicrobiales bacterium]